MKTDRNSQGLERMPVMREIRANIMTIQRILLLGK